MVVVQNRRKRGHGWGSQVAVFVVVAQARGRVPIVMNVSALHGDPDVLGETVRRSVRGAVGEAWGKKPICTVFVAVV